MSLLQEILETKRRELADLKQLRLPDAPPLRAAKLGRTPQEPLRLLTEIKRRSPSAGLLSTQLSISERAAAYARAGASVISVLCDHTYFDGSFEHLAEAREACSLPLLCKDFILHERQLEVARAYGADLALLIVRCLDTQRLKELFQSANALGLQSVVEVATPEEARVAVELGASIIGVNARDLDTLSMDRERAETILRALPEDRVRLHLSGISTKEQIRHLARGPADGALVGEALMRKDDPEPLLRELVQAASPGPPAQR